MSWSFQDNRPIYTQILEIIEYKIVSGEYERGSRLPSVRELAAQAAVNPNTMQRALSELERMGLLVTKRTAGRLVTDDEEIISNIKKDMACEFTATYVKNMQMLGYKSEEISKFFLAGNNLDEGKGENE